MSVAMVYLCGWAVGLVVLRHGVTRTWKNPEGRTEIAMIRQAFDSPAGLIAVSMMTFFLWWFLVAAIPWSIVGDWRYRPDDEDDS